MDNHLPSTTADPRPRGAESTSDLALNYPAAAEIPLSGDLLQGAKAIAAFLGLPIRRVNYLIEIGQLPAFRWAGRVCARRSRLRAFIEQLEAGAGLLPAKAARAFPSIGAPSPGAPADIDAARANGRRRS